MKEKKSCDLLIIGAGASGLMLGAQSDLLNKSVIIIDHNKNVGKKIAISGGGKCNFSNRDISPSNYLCNNPHFVKSALAGYTIDHFLEFIKKHKIPFEERNFGQLFCLRSATDITEALQKECSNNGVKFFMDQKNIKVDYDETFKISSDNFEIETPKLVIATGGLSMKKIGASDLGYIIAKNFGHSIIPTRPALVPFKSSIFKILSGISLKAKVSVGKYIVTDELLFTHQGLSGPAILNASVRWTPGSSLIINWLPDVDFITLLKKSKNKTISSLLKEHLPKRFIHHICKLISVPHDTHIFEISDKLITLLSQNINSYIFTPDGTLNFEKAEVTAGGVDTKNISSKNMESKLIPGLFFIGEVLDVTGHLGGYNFHWAWASAKAVSLSNM